MKNAFNLFRKIALLEGLSFLVLLFVAMPLKYMANIPQPVKILGSIHGFLFVAFLLLAVLVMILAKFKIFWLVKAIVASFLPFGTFYMDKFWKQEQIEFEK